MSEDELRTALEDIRDQCKGLMSYDDFKGAIYDIKRIADAALAVCNQSPPDSPTNPNGCSVE